MNSLDAIASLISSNPLTPSVSHEAIALIREGRPALALDRATRVSGDVYRCDIACELYVATIWLAQAACGVPGALDAAVRHVRKVS